jgi:hypothetical protein
MNTKVNKVVFSILLLQVASMSAADKALDLAGKFGPSVGAAVTGFGLARLFPAGAKATDAEKWMKYDLYDGEIPGTDKRNKDGFIIFNIPEESRITLDVGKKDIGDGAGAGAFERVSVREDRVNFLYPDADYDCYPVAQKRTKASDDGATPVGEWTDRDTQRDGARSPELGTHEYRDGQVRRVTKIGMPLIVAIQRGLLTGIGTPGRNGRDGEQGMQGDVGANGADGATTAEVLAAAKLDAGFMVSLKGEQGLQGADGLPGANGKDADVDGVVNAVEAKLTGDGGLLKAVQDALAGLTTTMTDGFAAIDGKLGPLADRVSGLEGKVGEFEQLTLGVRVQALETAAKK